MEAKPKRQLDVFWGRRLVGQYNLLSDETECFSYDVDYLASSDAVPISHSLPLRSAAYGRRQLRPFFSGLLPEESQRERIASYLGLPTRDDFSLLEAIGGECAGALTILPHGTTPSFGKETLVPCDEKRLVDASSKGRFVLRRSCGVQCDHWKRRCTWQELFHAV